MSTLLHLIKTMLLNLVYATLETSEEPRDDKHWKAGVKGAPTHINVETGEYGWGYRSGDVRHHYGSTFYEGDDGY